MTFLRIHVSLRDESYFWHTFERRRFRVKDDGFTVDLEEVYLFVRDAL